MLGEYGEVGEEPESLAGSLSLGLGDDLNHRSRDGVPLPFTLPPPTLVRSLEGGRGTSSPG
jgi:hypothetical protein